MLETTIPVLMSALMYAAPPDAAERDDGSRVWLERLAGLGFSGAVLAIDDEEVVVEQAYGLADVEAGRKLTVDSVFDIGSITKQFTAAAIMALEMEGKLAATDLLSKYVGALPPDKADVSLHHLLTHSAGFRGALGEDDEYLGAGDYVRRALASNLLFTPGDGYSYSNVGFSLLGIVVERVSGKGYEQFLRERFFDPLGMTDTGYVLPRWDPSRIAVCYREGVRWGVPTEKGWRPDGPGWHLRANGGIMTTLRDMRKWIEALEAESVIDAAHCDALFRPHVAEGGGTHYGYGWVVGPSPRGGQIRTHNGGNGILSADLWWHPARSRLVFVASTRSEWVADHVREGIVDFLDGEPRPMPPVVRTVSQAEVEAIVGTYRAGDDAIAVSASGASLEVEAKGWRAFAALQDPDAVDLDARLALAKESDALATKMRGGDFACLAKPYRGHRTPDGFVEHVRSSFVRHQESAGKWTAHETLGPSPMDDSIVVWFRCVNELQNSYAGIRWRDGVIVGMTFEERAPISRFVAVEGGGFESFSPDPADAELSPVRLNFASDAGRGKLTVRGRSQTHVFLRDADAGR